MALESLESLGVIRGYRLPSLLNLPRIPRLLILPICCGRPIPCTQPRAVRKKTKLGGFRGCKDLDFAQKQKSPSQEGDLGGG